MQETQRELPLNAVSNKQEGGIVTGLNKHAADPIEEAFTKNV
ncbi:MAG: hypothetical protein ACWA6V_20260 [Cellvibrio sp.]